MYSAGPISSRPYSDRFVGLTNYAMVPDPVAYTLSLQAVTVGRHFRLAVGPVAYTLGMQNVEFSVPGRLAVGALTYSVSMQNVNFSKTNVLQGNKLSFSVDISDVRLTISGSREWVYESQQSDTWTEESEIDDT